MGSSAGPGEQILPAIISRFRQLHPKVAVSLWVAGTREIIDRVLARELEIGVVGALAHHRELVVEPLARDEIVLVCNAQHPWAQRDDVSLPEVVAEPQIVQQQGSGVRTVVEDNLRTRGLRPASFNVVAEMGLNESAKQAVMAGDGVSFSAAWRSGPRSSEARSSSCRYATCTLSAISTTCTRAPGSWATRPRRSSPFWPTNPARSDSRPLAGDCRREPAASSSRRRRL